MRRPPHPIRAHLEETDESQASFARRAGISEGHLSEILSGVKSASASVARRLAKATRGKVDPEEIVLWQFKRAA